jgi:kynurenine formamidase
MSTIRVIDLSHMLETGMPVYPGSDPVIVEKIATLGKDGFQEIRLVLSTHSGTHVDCPRHLLAGGADAGMLPPEQFCGGGVVVDCSTAGAGVTIGLSSLTAHEKRISKADFVLLHTGWSRYWGLPQYTVLPHPVPDTEAASYLASFSLKGVGIDAFSFDPFDAADLPVHHILLGAGIILVENLTNLEALPETDFLFCCLPLKVREGDGGSVRAVGLVFSE